MKFIILESSNASQDRLIERTNRLKTLEKKLQELEQELKEQKEVES